MSRHRGAQIAVVLLLVLIFIATYADWKRGRAARAACEAQGRGGVMVCMKYDCICIDPKVRR